MQLSQKKIENLYSSILFRVKNYRYDFDKIIKEKEKKVHHGYHFLCCNENDLIT